METNINAFILFRKGDQVVYKADVDPTEIPVRLVWARPISGVGKEVSILHAEKKREICWLTAPEHPDTATAEIIKSELQTCYFLPEITRVNHTNVLMGNRYWQVETTAGKRSFVLNSPDKNVIWIDPNHFILKDTYGSCYKIPALDQLDAHSQAEIERIL